MGAQVIGIARGTNKMEIVEKMGADHVFDSNDPNLVNKLKGLGGVDVVYDPVGGDQFKSAFRSCNRSTHTFNWFGGKIPEIKANHLLVKNITIHGFYWGGFLGFNPEVIIESLKQLFDWYSSNKLSLTSAMYLS